MILHRPANVKDLHCGGTVYHELIVLGYVMHLRRAGVGEWGPAHIHIKLCLVSGVHSLLLLVTSLLQPPITASPPHRTAISIGTAHVEWMARRLFPDCRHRYFRETKETKDEGETKDKERQKERFQRGE